jgi:hypothetical protein
MDSDLLAEEEISIFALWQYLHEIYNSPGEPFWSCIVLRPESQKQPVEWGDENAIYYQK